MYWYDNILESIGNRVYPCLKAEDFFFRLKDLEMSCCKNGHTIHNECLDQRIYNLIKEEGHMGEFSIEYCPICQFEILDDNDAIRYLYHVLGHSYKDILEDIKKKYGNYDKFRAEMGILISKKMEEKK